MRRARLTFIGILWLACEGGLSACAGYQPRALPSSIDIKGDAAALKTDVGRLRLEPLKPVIIDATDGLDPIEIAALAVLNNADLDAKRVALGVNAAEVFSAGLLPDPQIALNFDVPVAGPDTLTAYGLAPSIDLAGVLARANNRRAALETARQADLDLLWAEWTTAQQARQLAETALADEARAATLHRLTALAQERSRQSTAALERRDTNSQTAASDMALELDLESQLTTAEHDAAKARHDLNALLNLAADVKLPLVPDRVRSSPSASQVEAALSSLPQRRPDLLALQAGYAAQDDKLRGAILAQFPLNALGAAYGRDTAGAVSYGLSANSALPIFNRGRGEVKIQTATREQMRAEYQARLDGAAAEARAAQAELAAADAQAEALRRQMPRLETLLRRGEKAYERRDLDSLANLSLAQSFLTRQAELSDRLLATRLAVIALETSLFLPPAGFGASS